MVFLEFRCPPPPPHPRKRGAPMHIRDTTIASISDQKFIYSRHIGKNFEVRGASVSSDWTSIIVGRRRISKTHSDAIWFILEHFFRGVVFDTFKQS